MVAKSFDGGEIEGTDAVDHCLGLRIYMYRIFKYYISMMNTTPA